MTSFCCNKMILTNIVKFMYLKGDDVMSNSKRSKDILSTRKIELYNKNAEIIAYWRRNPVIACEDLLGIKLLDSQKYILNMTWNAQYSVWACS